MVAKLGNRNEMQRESKTNFGKNASDSPELWQEQSNAGARVREE